MYSKHKVLDNRSRTELMKFTNNKKTGEIRIRSIVQGSHRIYKTADEINRSLQRVFKTTEIKAEWRGFLYVQQRSCLC